MKFVLLFVGVALLQMIVEAKPGAKRIENFKACSQELKITPEMMKEARESKNFDKPEFKCLSACVMKKAGLLEPGNKYNVEKMKAYSNKKYGDKAAEIIKVKEDCIAEAKSITDECDFARSIDRCTHKKLPDLYKKE